MKKLFSTLAIVFAASMANASLEAIQVVSSPIRVPSAVKAVEAHVLSSVAAGTASVKAVRKLYLDEPSVTELAPVTNVTYQLVYRDGSATVTNVTPYDVDFRYIGTNYVSYATNVTVTVPAVTNIVRTLKLCATNEILSVTCSGGIGSGTPASTTYLEPGVELFFTGTAKGNVILFVEK